MTADKNSETKNEGCISPKRKLSGTETDQVGKRVKSSFENEDNEQNNDVPHTENSSDAGEQNNDIPHTENSSDAGEQDGQMEVGTASNSTGQSPMKIYAGCKICDKQFNGPQNYLAHLSSAGHKKKVGVKPIPAEKSEVQVEIFKCRLCNKAFSGPIPYDQHMISKVHRKNVTIINLNMKFKDAKGNVIIHPELKTENNTAEGDKELSCEICSKKFTGIIPYNVHLSSSSHINKVNALLFDKSALKDQPELSLKFGTPQVIKQWSCEICNKRFTGPIPHDAHISSASHTKKVNASLLDKVTAKSPPCINDPETNAKDLPADE